MRKVNPGRFAESGSAGERPDFRKREFVKSGESNRFWFIYAGFGWAARGLVFGERQRADLYKYKPTRCTQSG